MFMVEAGRLPALLRCRSWSCWSLHDGMTALMLPERGEPAPLMAAIPAPVAPGHSQQVGAIGHGLPGHGGHVHGSRALKQRHFGAERLRLPLQPELGDAPPPDLGFMIKNGRCGRAAAAVRMAAVLPSVVNAVVAVAAANSISPTASAATHSRPASANETRISTGAAIARMSPIHRSRPL